MKKISILIVEDQELMIDGLKAMLEKELGIEVVGYTMKALEAESLTQKLSPDVILMDFDFPEKDIDGIKIAKEILAKKGDSVKIIMLTNYDEYALINEAYRSGIKGYVPKNASKQSLIRAIKTVVDNRFYFDDVFDKIFNPAPEPVSAYAGSSPSFYPLTRRELDVATIAFTGKSRKEIASELFISHNTVDTHFKNIFAKLEVKNRAGMINWLIKQKLV